MVIRIGVLGAARVVSYALVQPARNTPGVEVHAIASRSAAKAKALADSLTVPRAIGSYDELLADAQIDAVYIALPTAWHPTWARRALEAGKHVLCEKPLAADGQIAADLVALARSRRQVLQEGLHFRFLPKLQRQRALVASGELGSLRHVESCLRLPKLTMAPDDFRRHFELGGGAGLDLGCYAASCLRFIAGEEPEVVSASSRSLSKNVDRWMRARCRFPSGATGTIECGFKGWYSQRIVLDATCERGSVKWDKTGLTLTRDGRTSHEELPDGWTYQQQLDAFAKSIRGEPSSAAPVEDMIGNARVLQAMYAQAGLAPRPVASA